MRRRECRSSAWGRSRRRRMLALSRAGWIVLLASWVWLLGCAKVCPEAISGGLAVKSCLRQVQACRMHRYKDGSLDAYAVSLDGMGSNFASVLKAGFYAILGGLGFGPPGAAAGAGASVVEDVTSRDRERPMCFEHWRDLLVEPTTKETTP